MLIASTSLIVDPVWPWSLPYLGWPAVLLVAGVLAGLTVLTYLVGQRANAKQFAIVLTLRLLALLIVCLLILRPALAHREENVTPSKLILLVDHSSSMNNKDEFNGKSRWEAAWRLLQTSSVKQAIQRLQDQQKVEIVYLQAAEKVEPFEPEGNAEGKRTDMGLWLNELYNQYGSDPNLRGLIIIGDGADNDTTFPTLQEAKKWRCPIHTIGLGSPKTTAGEKDIFFVANSLIVSPSPVPIKTKMTIKAIVNAPGLAWVQRPLRLFLNDKQVKLENITLNKENKIELVIDAPAQPGDYKVTLKIDPHPAEVSELNNEISTYVNVTKDGISVLWVEGKKRLEATWVIRHVLSKDPKVRVFYSERIKEKEPLPLQQKDWFNFEKQHYDVIVIGDISASRFSGDDPAVFPQIESLIKKGTGLLMLGGYESFANSDWQKYPEVSKMLPVDLNQVGQVEGLESVRVEPTEAGLDHYVLKLSEDAKVNKQIWNNLFKPLDGMTKIGTVRQEAVTLATSGGDKNQPVMAFKNYGGRVAVFGGDTTWKSWRKSFPAIDNYERFWKKLIYWLAQKDKVGDDVWVKLDARRLPAGGNVNNGITVGLNPDKSKNYPSVRYEVKVIGPNKEESRVATLPKANSDKFEERGNFWKTNAPGEYVVKVDAFDDKGKKINDTTTEARFLTYAQDLETLRPAADHVFLSRLASASDGQFRLASEAELADLLSQISHKAALASVTQKSAWPDWDRDPISSSVPDQVSSLINSGILFCYLLFTSLLCLEWYLRRRWSMV